MHGTSFWQMAVMGAVLILLRKKKNKIEGWNAFNNSVGFCRVHLFCEKKSRKINQNWNWRNSWKKERSNEPYTHTIANQKKTEHLWPCKE